MALMRITSPHAHGPMQTSVVMQNVLLATVPGIVVLTHFFGFGTLVNVIWACVLAVLFESIALKLRARPLGFYLRDYSAVVTATLLGIALPPYAPWWLIAVGVAGAILLAKHLYGGLGYNIFNPAMASNTKSDFFIIGWLNMMKFKYNHTNQYCFEISILFD